MRRAHGSAFRMRESEAGRGRRREAPFSVGNGLAHVGRDAKSLWFTTGRDPA